MRTLFALLLLGAVGVLPALFPSATTADEEQTFLATLMGGNETPPNDSSALARATAVLNPDATVTYTVKGTGFDTHFLAAHVHTGAFGVPGPVMFPIDCNSFGTACSGTSRPLTTDEVGFFAAGNTYVNMHTAAFPGGEIRGQLVPSSLAPPAGETTLRTFSGSAKGVGLAPVPGSSGGADISIAGRLQINGPLDLRTSTAVIEQLLYEENGAEELVRGPSGTPALPLPLLLVRRDTDRREVTYRATPDGTHPACRLRLKARGRGVFDFAIDCKQADGTNIPFAPALCSGSSPTTQLTTTFSINAASPVQLTVVQTWGCALHDGLVSELRFPAEGSSSGGSGSGGSGGGGANRAPRADFRADPLAGSAPLTVHFTNRSSDLDGDALTSSWDFGDGTQSTESDPTHTYATPGRFNATLLVTDAHGLSSGRKVTTIGVTPGAGGGPSPGNHAPLADFDANLTSGPAPLKVSFVNRSTDPDGDPIAAHWDFGDGSASSDSSPTHIYTRGGDFVVTLVVTDAHGLPSAPKSESISVTGAGTGGGGTPGGSNSAPRADFRANPTSGDAPLLVTFTNSSTDPNGDALASHWDFGDGFRSSEASPSHTYTNAGQYTVTLTVTDAHGLSSQPKQENVTVRAGSGAGGSPGGGVPGGPNSAPRADFGASPASGNAPLIVTFSNRSTDGDGDALTAHWDFGDGIESSEMSPTHTYTSAGAFTVTLVVTDARGLSSEPKREDVTVRGIGSGGTPPPSGPNHAPRADFRVDHASGPAPLTVTFSNNSTDPDGDLLTSLWDFGDGTVSSEPTPKHTYTSAGSFTVVLVVTDARGLSSAPKQENITVRSGGPLPPTTTTLPPPPATTTTTTPPAPSTTTTTRPRPSTTTTSAPAPSTTTTTRPLGSTTTTTQPPTTTPTRPPTTTTTRPPTTTTSTTRPPTTTTSTTRPPATTTSTTSTTRPSTPTTTTTLPPVSFVGQVHPIFAANCAFPACHSAPAVQKGLDMTTPASAYASLVNVPSAECPTTFRVAPRLPDSSYIIFKLQGAGPCFHGSQMPLGGVLPAADIAIIRQWILEGARNN